MENAQTEKLCVLFYHSTISLGDCSSILMTAARKSRARVIDFSFSSENSFNPKITSTSVTKVSIDERKTIFVTWSKDSVYFTIKNCTKSWFWRDQKEQSHHNSDSMEDSKREHLNLFHVLLNLNADELKNFPQAALKLVTQLTIIQLRLDFVCDFLDRTLIDSSAFVLRTINCFRKIECDDSDE